eukprot:COSAG01_NODE_1623_length_9708_cov_32.044438_17_plen_85_part_00
MGCGRGMSARKKKVTIQKVDEEELRLVRDTLFALRSVPCQGRCARTRPPATFPCGEGRGFSWRVDRRRWRKGAGLGWGGIMFCH